jgi:hypothetical protein
MDTGMLRYATEEGFPGILFNCIITTFDKYFSVFLFAPRGRARQPCFNFVSRGGVVVLFEVVQCRRIRRHLHIIALLHAKVTSRASLAVALAVSIVMV